MHIFLKILKDGDPQFIAEQNSQVSLDWQNLIIILLLKIIKINYNYKIKKKKFS